MTENGHKPWGQIKVAEADEVPPQRNSQWFELYQEVSLRLEQTPKAWLEIPFEAQNIRDCARNALNRYAQARKGSGAIECRSLTKTEDGQFILYVRRGKNWKK